MDDILRASAFILGFGLVFISFMVIEAYVLTKRNRGDVYDFKESLANMVTGASYKVVDGIAIALMITACYEFVAQYGLKWDPEVSVFSIFALIVVADLCMYIQHYLMHKIRWFWVIHVTHHSSTRMNLSTALRQNFLYVVGPWMFVWLPLALIGFKIEWALIAIEANLVYQFFLHTEAYNAPKWYGKIFNTPSHHRVHHGSNEAQIDRNFGGVLIVWDKLFGTFQDEETAGEIKYGVPRMPKKPYNPFYIQTYEIAEILSDLKRYKDLRILWKPPEWVHREYKKKSNLFDS